ncbi:hypothetical protein BV22DRAFT_1049268 [Leucogyrophana mollusca]|uniref:Uncharacterized protein n=1 Tax=Leucogyrophana mollusca TaxID=85980 RepID=A0ACB8BAN6_9AGAM|nr:hypothetical protein BV22DRAFT_1049268 [Leucogyrophana mollusca]
MSVFQDLYERQSLDYVIIIAAQPDFLAVASGAVVMYDQAMTKRNPTVLNLSQENRRWSIMTALYFVARYCGSVFVFTYAAADLRLNWTLTWISTFFTAAMQAILLMRAYALCNRSKAILVFLLVFISGMVFNPSVVGRYVLAMGPSVGSVLEEGDANLSVLEPWLTIAIVLQLAFDTVVLVIALFASAKHALEARRLHGGWSINPLVQALVADQILYFLCYAVWQALSVPLALPSSGAANSPLLNALSMIFTALAVIAGPRMVISLRAYELKTREGTFREELSTIQFGARDLPPQAAGEGGPEFMTA